MILAIVLLQVLTRHEGLVALGAHVVARSLVADFVIAQIKAILEGAWAFVALELLFWVVLVVHVGLWKRRNYTLVGRLRERGLIFELTQSPVGL